MHETQKLSLDDMDLLENRGNATPEEAHLILVSSFMKRSILPSLFESYGNDQVPVLDMILEKPKNLTEVYDKLQSSLDVCKKVIAYVDYQHFDDVVTHFLPKTTLTTYHLRT